MAIKVLHHLSSLGDCGGIQSHVLEIFRNINRNEVHLGFITSAPNDLIVLKDMIDSGTEIFICPRFRFINLFSYLKWWTNFLQCHSEYRILHGHIRCSAWLYLTICKHYRLTTIIHSHSTSNGNDILSVIKTLHQYPIRYLADYLLSCSNESGRWLYGNKIHTSKYRVFPNCINISKFVFNAEIRTEVRHELNLTNEFVIGHVGRFHPSKNHIYLLKVFREIRKHIDARLLLVGDGPTEKNIRRLAHQWKLEDHILFIGSTHQTARYYHSMDCFVFPSLWEGFPIALLEAQANGLPVVFSDSISDDAILTDRTIKLSVSLKPEKWAQAILQLKQTRRCELSAKEYDAFQKYDAKVNALALQSFYLEIAEK